jgi:hypothetical protein
MEFWMRTMAPEKLACYVMGADGKDGCRVAFLAKEYAAGKKGLCLNGANVRIIEVFLPDSENRSAHCLYHHNHGYTVGEIIQCPTQHNKM